MIHIKILVMKNIHLLPTKNPSRLYLHSNGELQLRHNLSRTDDYLGSNQHIYITSDEEIKEGDWVLDILSNKIIKSELKLEDNGRIKKIILTTDLNLIDDGVQEITNTFAEWFVENPTCEYVETKLVEFEVDMGLGDSCIEHGSYYKINTIYRLPFPELVEDISKHYETVTFTSTLGSELQPNTITFSLKNNEPVIVLDEVGFKYKGELIEDAGEIYKLFKEFIENRIKYTEEQLKLAYMQGYNRGKDGNPNHMEAYIEFIKQNIKD